MKKKIYLFLILFASLLGTANAQDIKVTGRVTDAATGNPIDAATISVKGKTKAVASNANGDFTIVTNSGATLVVSSVGYAKKEVEATTTALNISLAQDKNNLADVVVVGYGTQKRGNITGAVTVIKGAELTKRPLASTSMTLQGLAPGVTVQQGSGQPGADGGNINIRGIGSITGGTFPLIIADGVEGVSLNDIDPNIIESISILKDAASTAIYGVRGNNGVILIKTKRAQAGRTSISYNSFVSKQTPTNFPELVSSIDHMILNNEYQTNASQTATYTAAEIERYRTTPADNQTVFDTDWKGLVLQNNGILQNHNLIISGGSDKASFLASGTFLQQQGLIVNNSFKKYDLRMNGDINFTNKIKFTSDLFYTKAINIRPAGMSTTDIIQRSISMARLFPGKFGDGQYGDAGQNSNFFNPIGFAESSGISRAETPTLSLRFSFSAEIFKNFVVDAAYNNRTSYTEAYDANTTYNSFNPNPATNTYIFNKVIGDSTLRYTNNRFNSNQYSANANYSFNLKNKHHFKFQAGFQAIDNFSKSITSSRAGLLDPSRPYFNLVNANPAQPGAGGGASDFALAGYLSRINYSFNDKYLLELTGRYDGSSRFSQLVDAQWGFFPGFSAGWILTKEKFMDNIPFVNFAKLRFSYGKLGNQDVGVNGDYPFVQTINAGSAYYFNNVLTRGSSINGVPNETISWETSTQKNIAIDLILFKNKLNITFEKYVKKMDDMILDLPLSNGSGFPGGSIPGNFGAMVNKGWEFSTTYTSKINKLNYSVTANLSDVKNEVTDTKNQDIVNGNQLSRNGYPIRSYLVYLTDGLYQKGDNFTSPSNASRPLTGAGDIKFRDVDGDGAITSKDRVLLGNNFPRYEYSLNVNADFKGIDFNVFLYGVGKRNNYISGAGVEPFNAPNWTSSALVSALDRWTPENPNAKYPRLFRGGNQNYTSSDFFLRDGSFMRIKQISIGYSLPKKIISRLKIQQLRFYVNTVNPFTFSNYEPGFDPEPSNTTGAFYPIVKTTTVGINLKF